MLTNLLQQDGIIAWPREISDTNIYTYYDTFKCSIDINFRLQMSNHVVLPIT